MKSHGPKVIKSSPLKPLMFSNRVMLKSIFEGGDGKAGLVGKRVVVGGWVKSSKEVKNEPVPPPPAPAGALPAAASAGPKDVKFVEILKSRMPCLRTIGRVLGGSARSPAVREKLQSLIPEPTPPSTFFLLEINDGSCVSSLKVVIDSTIAPVPAGQLLPSGTSVLAEGVLEKPSAPEKQAIELKVEKILHVGTVEQDAYPLSRKRLPLDSLRDYPHIRPRTTTVASVTRIRSALDSATHTFFQNRGFLHVHVPIITTIDSEGFSEKFQVTTLLEKPSKEEEPVGVSDADAVSLETVKAAIKEKSNQVAQLERSDSNREAYVAALQDLLKTNELAQQIEAREKSKRVTAVKFDVKFNEDFFGRQSYLTVSGRLHLESYACALGHVYSFGPRFRADKTFSAKHVAEMWTVEAEMAFSQLEDAMKCAEDYLKFVCGWISDNCSEDMKFVSKRIDTIVAHCLEYMTSSSYDKIPYSEAVEILSKVTDKAFETQFQWGLPLTDEHLSYLADDHYKRPVIIYDYPKAVKPFYVRLNDDGKTVAAFEMVVPKIGTVIKGSQNEERFDMLNKRIKEFDLPTDQYEWYLDLRRHGTVKHSGFSLGFDLMVLLITGLSDVRDVIPFPRSHGKANN